jgi:hypothetical protein
VTEPVEETVATAVFELAHATVRPVSTWFAASRNVTDACVTCPTEIGEVRVTDTLATGGALTVSAALPVTPPDVARICAVPGETAVTSPLLFTVAIEVLELDHVTVRPVRMFPDASRSVALACVV